MPKKILYLMHLDWRWIKQRPHFIAEGLSEFYDVTVIHFYSKRYFFRHSDTSTPNEKNLKLIPAFRMPFYQKKIIYDLNKAYMKLYFKFLIEKYDPDFLWITFPQLYDYIPSKHRCKIIYDCMDLSTGFDYQENFNLKVSKIEKKLIEDASIIFVSSNYLLKKLDETYHCGNKLILTRNAFSGEIIIDNRLSEKNKKNSFKIGYVGIISPWIDFEKIKFTLEKIKNIEYHLIGPYDPQNVELEHNKIIVYGSVNYNELYDQVKNFDCLIVPFKLSERILAADPGKIYGYINFNKPIISVYYDELNYFSSFIDFYSSKEELVELLKKMIDNGFNKKYSDLKRLEFLENNSWDVRMHTIIKFLEEL